MSTSFRAGVMLSVLVGLPAAWVYYGPLPPAAQRVVDQFVAAAKEAAGWNATSTEGLLEAGADEATEFVIGGEAPVAATAAHAPAATAQPSTSRSPIDLPSEHDNAPATPVFSARQALEPLLARLRQLGAAHYVLEPWGAGQNLFRFRCEMPLAASDAMTQQFEAIAADPAASVEQVVAEVASWQAARGNGAIMR